MNRQSPRSATALYATAATCAVIGALLWLRSRTNEEPLSLYGDSSDPDSYLPSSWRVWSTAVPEERLGMYLLAVALLLALAARVVATWREQCEQRERREEAVPE
ncbi:hypothetical protein ACIBM4_16990 [Streptomyces sp. NPDC050256]|uniref:hypothetical protein n=1 Tax=Streptomyces sp. NPDC050256 TaxID=3365607 RepID=UPI0037B17446